MEDLFNEDTADQDPTIETKLQNKQEEEKKEKEVEAGPTPEEIKKLVKEGKVCFKCKKVAPNYTVRQDLVCRPCLKDILVHRFKSNLR